MTGRPTTRTEEIVESILDQIGDGISLMSICRQEGMPKLRTVYGWIDGDADLSARFAGARKAGMDMLAQEALDIADDGTNDFTEGKNGPMLDAEHVQRSKLRIETRLKLLRCWDHARYGDRQQVEHSGTMSLEALVSGTVVDSPAK